MTVRIAENRSEILKRFKASIVQPKLGSELFVKLSLTIKMKKILVHKAISGESSLEALLVYEITLACKKLQIALF